MNWVRGTLDQEWSRTRRRKSVRSIGVGVVVDSCVVSLHPSLSFFATCCSLVLSSTIPPHVPTSRLLSRPLHRIHLIAVVQLHPAIPLSTACVSPRLNLAMGDARRSSSTKGKRLKVRGISPRARGDACRACELRPFDLSRLLLTIHPRVPGRARKVRCHPGTPACRSCTRQAVLMKADPALMGCDSGGAQCGAPSPPVHVHKSPEPICRECESSGRASSPY